jgi:sec-independent protein translocase protein TatC
MSFLFPDHDVPQDDDPFANTRMSFGDHIEDLRRHLLRAIYGFLVALVAGVALARPATIYLAEPVEVELKRIYDRRVAAARDNSRVNDDVLNQPREMEVYLAVEPLARALGVKRPNDAPEKVAVTMSVRPWDVFDVTDPALSVVRPQSLKSFTVMESFMVWLRVAIYIALVLAAPWIFIQLWSFIAAGLYPQEKRLVNYYLPVSIALFLTGVVFCQFVVIPRAVEYLLSFNEWLGLQPELRLSDWLSFAVLAPLIFGVAFQTPLLMFFLYRLGIVNRESYSQHRRIAWFGLACAAVILVPSPDVFTFLALTFPLWALYELGIVLCRFAPRPEFATEDTELEQMVEV